MKKYIFLTAMFIFANNVFSQQEICVTLPRIHGVTGILSGSNIISCSGGTITVSTNINQWEVIFPDDYVEEINQALSDAGLDYIHVYSITYPYSSINFVFDENYNEYDGYDHTRIVIFKAANELCKNGIEIIQFDC
ncbi:MAG: hypothetical protein LBK94_02840 [Prevotellaceae bacterium]|jgi:hypothetical protein|nr:hypothetical protein [Prevotellaceae bacterium]